MKKAYHLHSPSAALLNDTHTQPSPLLPRAPSWQRWPCPVPAALATRWWPPHVPLQVSGKEDASQVTGGGLGGAVGSSCQQQPSPFHPPAEPTDQAPPSSRLLDRLPPCSLVELPGSCSQQRRQGLLPRASGVSQQLAALVQGNECLRQLVGGRGYAPPSGSSA